MNTSETTSSALELQPNDTHLLAKLCGQFDEHIRHIEKALSLQIRFRGNTFQLDGHKENVERGVEVLQKLYQEIQESDQPLTEESIHLHLHESEQPQTQPASDGSVAPITIIRTKQATIKPRGRNQQGYVRAVQTHDINFGVGPAGTGKTYLAVACAVEALLADKVQRILLVRPAVEAGEKLGFLPGDLAQKIDPYLRPLYDALYEMLGFETVGKLIERNVIEVAPLAFMRGRTLNDSFIILDEAQNTTREQMKMFLTRIGFGSTAVITGDATQIDLPRGSQSGLTHVLKVLEEVEGISITYFGARDVVRHPLVQRIVQAYDKLEGDAAKLDKQK